MLRSLISQVAGTDEDMTARIANTFASVVKLGDFKSGPPKEENKDPPLEAAEDDAGNNQTGTRKFIKGLRTEFVYNIQVVLPSNASEETYLNIFNAIRKTFQ